MIFLPFALRLLHQVGHELRAFGVVERIADGHVVQNFLERERHAAADDDFVGLVEQVVDELNLVRDLRAAEDREQRTLRMVEHRAERIQFLLHQVAARALRKLHAGHRAVIAMRGAEGVVDVNIAELREAGAKRLHLFRIGFELGAVFELHLALFLDVEAEVFEQESRRRAWPWRRRLRLPRRRSH